MQSRIYLLVEYYKEFLAADNLQMAALVINDIYGELIEIGALPEEIAEEGILEEYINNDLSVEEMANLFIGLELLSYLDRDVDLEAYVVETEEKHFYMGTAVMVIVEDIKDAEKGILIRKEHSIFPVAAETLKEFEEMAYETFEEVSGFFGMRNEITKLMTVEETISRYKKLGVKDGLAALLVDQEIEAVMSCDTYIGDRLVGIVLVPVVDMEGQIAKEQVAAVLKRQ